MVNKTTRRPRGRPRSFDRDVVLKQAMHTFWRLGYEGTSIADLTAAMGITVQSLYTAFGSKSALYYESLKLYQTTVGAFFVSALNEEPTATAAFSRILQESAAEFCKPQQPRGCMISIAVLTCAVENQAEAVHVAQLRGLTIKVIQQRLEQAVTEGEFKAGTDSAALARYIGATIQGMSIQAQDGATQKELLSIANIAILGLKNFQADRLFLVEPI